MQAGAWKGQLDRSRFALSTRREKIQSITQDGRIARRSIEAPAGRIGNGDAARQPVSSLPDRRRNQPSVRNAVWPAPTLYLVEDCQRKIRRSECAWRLTEKRRGLDQSAGPGPAQGGNTGRFFRLPVSSDGVDCC